ncbi:hypothetical protein [Gemmata sp.]|uniref:hypothetical protein n=1 Tax=Gemmata sp. TaxID=1914242 RepID=UPI003F728A59
MKLPPHNYRVALSPDGRYLAHSPDGTAELVVVDLAGREPREVRRTNVGGVAALGFHPGGQRLAYSTGEGLCVVDVATGKTLWEWKGAPGAVLWAQWADDGRHLVTHNANKTVYVLRLPDLSGAADRAAAEWALSVGGKVYVKDAAGGGEVKDAKQLPVAPFAVTSVFLAYTMAGDAGLERLKGCTSLVSLNLHQLKGITDTGLAHIKGLVGLTELDIAGSQVTDAGVEHLKGMTKLVTLSIHDTLITNAALTHIAGFGELTTLFISGTPLTDDGIEPLQKTAKLEFLELKRTKVTAAGVAKLAKALPKCKISWDGGVIEPTATAAADPDRTAAEWVIAQRGFVRINGVAKDIKAVADLPKERFALKVVMLDNTTVADADLANFRQFSLTHLGLSNTTVTDAGLAQLKGLGRLESLNIHATAVTDAGLVHLKGCAGLTDLAIGSTRVTGSGLVHLKELKDLSFLVLTGLSLTDSDLAHLKELKGLTRLGLWGTGVTPKGLAEFHAAVPACKIEHDGGTIGPKK